MHRPGEQEIPCPICPLPAPEGAGVLRRDGHVLVLAVSQVVRLQREDTFSPRVLF